ncbi:hypothetical protein R3P38DRAFT_2776399 [Favolaschia claudopus]|uniref:Uncharacterized protein n=1 Tax=Favolaschia claudopus TaxID=2862362 RepID=A0AAW0BNM8_9AGAR
MRLFGAFAYDVPDADVATLESLEHYSALRLVSFIRSPPVLQPANPSLPKTIYADSEETDRPHAFSNAIPHRLEGNGVFGVNDAGEATNRSPPPLEKTRAGGVGRDWGLEIRRLKDGAGEDKVGVGETKRRGGNAGRWDEDENGCAGARLRRGASNMIYKKTQLSANEMPVRDKRSYGHEYHCFSHPQCLAVLLLAHALQSSIALLSYCRRPPMPRTIAPCSSVPALVPPLLPTPQPANQYSKQRVHVGGVTERKRTLSMLISPPFVRRKEKRESSPFAAPAFPIHKSSSKLRRDPGPLRGTGCIQPDAAIKSEVGKVQRAHGSVLQMHVPSSSFQALLSLFATHAFRIRCSFVELRTGSRLSDCAELVSWYNVLERTKKGSRLTTPVRVKWENVYGRHQTWRLPLKKKRASSIRVEDNGKDADVRTTVISPSFKRPSSPYSPRSIRPSHCPSASSKLAQPAMKSAFVDSRMRLRLTENATERTHLEIYWGYPFPYHTEFDYFYFISRRLGSTKDDRRHTRFLYRALPHPRRAAASVLTDRVAAAPLGFRQRKKSFDLVRTHAAASPQIRAIAAKRPHSMKRTNERLGDDSKSQKVGGIAVIGQEIGENIAVVERVEQGTCSTRRASWFGFRNVTVLRSDLM